MQSYQEPPTLPVLVGETLVEVRVHRDGDCDEIVFVTATGRKFKMFHKQDCCEQVSIEDITGDLQDLIGSPILVAEESSNSNNADTDCGEYSQTWTFYKFATVKAAVDIRWMGTSNGYYSEVVSFVEIAAPTEDSEYS